MLFTLLAQGELKNAVQVTKALKDVVNKPISTQTIQNGLKKVGMKAVVKKKRPRLTPHHRKERLDFAMRIYNCQPKNCLNDMTNLKIMYLLEI